MKSDSTLVYIIAGITALHFLVGMGYLLYKLGAPSKKKKENDSE
ncbi:MULTISPECIES: hypothetical protein [Labilibaculum]|nr:MULTISPECIES: hypothetical protein [Labilibaculum]MDQ1769805.1 hypothetical protein [Labilibaculum euxinus]